MTNERMFENLRYDIPASLVVFLVALPLCLGIALASGAPLFSGIIAGIVGGIVVGAISGSQLSVSGPAAGLTVIVAGAISSMPSYPTFLLAVVLSGLMQVVFGRLRAGVIGDFVPSAVIKGMLTAIGLILIFKQIPHLMGYDADYIGDEDFAQHDGHTTLSELTYAWMYVRPGALIIGIVSIFLQLVWDTRPIRTNPVLKFIPGSLMVVCMGVVLNQWYSTYAPQLFLDESFRVAIPSASTAREFGSFLTFPDFTQALHPKVWTVAVTLALVASLESLLSLEAADKLDPLNRVSPPNRELYAQGIGNIVSGLLGGLPVTAVIVRTSANVSASAKSKASAILHGVLLLSCVAFIPELLNRIPLSALAAVLIMVGSKLAKPSMFTDMYAKDKQQFLAYTITVIAILFTDLLIGILIGVVCSFFFIIRSTYHTGLFIVNHEGRYLLRFGQEVSFLNKANLRHSLEEIPADSTLVIDATRSRFIDKDIIEVVEEYSRHAALKNISLIVKDDGRTERDAFGFIPRKTISGATHG
ncbi:MAG: SulP family inorganic anion transporter [Candidatus Kapaibacterium sp.]